MTLTQETFPTPALQDGSRWRRDDDTLQGGIIPRTNPLEQAPAAVWTTDRDLRFTSVRGAELARCAPEQLTGTFLTAFFREEDPEFGPVAAHRQALTGRSVTFEFSRDEKCYFGRVEPLYDSWGQLAGTVAVAVDISERVLLETRRRQRDARALDARKNQALMVLAGGVAHNFNNLLTAVLGYTSLALMKLTEDSPFRDILREVESAAQCAADLSGQMLVYAQRQKLNNEEIELNQMIAKEATVARPALRKNVTLTHDLAATVPLVEGDAEQLRCLFHNLLVNAVEAIGPAGGTIAWKTRALHADRAFLADNFPGEALAPGRYVLVQISDTGAGMDEETRARIFEPFFSTKFVGRGMGLAAALGIVHGHQGAIAVTTKPGAGTTVTVLLPAV